MEDKLTKGQIHYRKYKDLHVKYREANREKLAAEARNYRKRKADKLRLISRTIRDNIHFGGFRTQVLQRDNYTCQKCGMTNEEHITKWKREITIDHIDGQGRYSETQNNALENLITLCLSCHGRKDKIRGLQKKEHDK